MVSPLLTSVCAHVAWVVFVAAARIFNQVLDAFGLPDPLMYNETGRGGADARLFGYMVIRSHHLRRIDDTL